jgi:hypothetical protein
MLRRRGHNDNVSFTNIVIYVVANSESRLVSSQGVARQSIMPICVQAAVLG